MSWRSVVFSTVVLSLFAAAGQGASCTSGTLQSYIVQPTAVCTIGGLSFGAFNFKTLSSQGGPTPITPAQISVTPMVAGDQIGFMFSSGNGFSVNTGQKIQYSLSYAIADPPIIHGYATGLQIGSPVSSTAPLDLTADVVTFPGDVNITSDQCLGANFSGSTCKDSTAEETVFSNGLMSSLTAEAFFPPVSLLGDQVTITLDATSGGSASFQGFTEFAIAAPEPSGTLPLALGLLALLLRRRKR